MLNLSLNELEPELISELVDEMDTEWNEFLRHEEKREAIKEEMLRVLSKLERKIRNSPKCKGLVSEFHVARIIAETGPLDDLRVLTVVSICGFKHTAIF